MALTVLRLRRAVYLSSSILHLRTLSTPPPLSFATITNHHPTLNSVPSQSRHFRSSSISLSSARSSFRNNNNYDDEIGPDTILFEGCDYNHWLITMDFPKDPAPTREEMIETYLQTLAQVVGSYEEAKKKMYAFSTTIYQGFQCLVSEEESEKFKDLQGVVFVLPDSYIDPVNKRYGGDQYDNGVITPMPPPTQYGRHGGKFGDHNRDVNRDRRQIPNDQGARGYDNQGPRHGDNRNFGRQQNPSAPYWQSNGGYDNQGRGYGGNTKYGQQHNPQMPNQQPNPLFANQRPIYGDSRNNGQHQNPTAQPNYGPSGGVRRDHLPTNNAPGRRDSVPPYQSYAYNQNQNGYSNPEGDRVATEQRGYTGPNINYAPPQGLTQGQGAGGSYGQMGGANNVQGSGSKYGEMPGGHFGQGVGMNHSQGHNYQKDFSGHQEEMPPIEQRNNLQGEQRNYGQMVQTGTDQGRF